MSIKQRVGRQIGGALAPRLTQVAPGVTTGFVRQALQRAIAGVGPLPPAASGAETHLREQDGDVDKAVREVIEQHVRYAGAQGFLTNLGGLVTMAVTVPANITGLTLIQCRMIASIAHLRGYDLADPRTRNAVLVTLLGEDAVSQLVKQRKVPAPPMALATAPHHDAALETAISQVVASELISRVAGKRLASTVGRRVPVVGGLVGLSADGWTTWKVGRYAAKELLPRATR